MRKWLCGFLSAVLLLGVAVGFPVRVKAASDMVASDVLIEFLKAEEGFSSVPYEDYGQLTVGYGTLCPPDKVAEYTQNGITEEAAMELLLASVEAFGNDLNAFAAEHGLTLTQNQFDALLSFSFNCGSAWMEENNGYFNNVVRSGDTGASFLYAIGLWCKADGECVLLDRRMREANMYINGVYAADNGVDPGYPDTYRWVFLDGCGGEMPYNVYAFDASLQAPISVSFDTVPTGTNYDGEPFSYTFAGWYTADGRKVEQLDDSVRRDQVLYAKWADPAGSLVRLSNDGPVEGLRVTVELSQVNVRSGPGTHSAKVDVVRQDAVLDVYEVYTTNNYTWGRIPQGWMCLDYTDYEEVLSGGKWVLEDGGWAYHENGKPVVNAWRKDSKGWYYLGTDGYMVYNKWVKDSTGWCYVGPSGYMVYDQWVRDSVGWCYVGADGYIVSSQWIQDGDKTYYCDASGYRVTGTQVIDGKNYYFDSDGVLQDQYTVVFQDYDGTVLSSATYNHGDKVVVPKSPVREEDDIYTYTFAGWDKEVVPCAGDATYTATYTATPKAVRNGWVLEGGKWYYYENGEKVTNAWREDSTGWCYLDAKGLMVYNKWVRDSIGWCYVGADGYMVYNKWVKDSKGWCYVGSSGYMVYDQWVQDSQGWCYIGSDGYFVTNKWVRDSVGWCYLDSNGRMVYNKWVRDSIGWCYVGADGYMTYNKWVQDSKGWCYIGPDGYMTYNKWVQDSKGWCYVGADGYMVTNRWVSDSSGPCYIGPDGYVV